MGLTDLSNTVPLQLPVQGDSSNGHMFQVLFPDEAELQRVRSGLAGEGILAVTHYVPLHSSPQGVLVGKSTLQENSITDRVASGLLRMPMFPGLENQINRIIDVLYRLYK